MRLSYLTIEHWIKYAHLNHLSNSPSDLLQKQKREINSRESVDWIWLLDCVAGEFLPETFLEWFPHPYFYKIHWRSKQKLMENLLGLKLNPKLAKSDTKTKHWFNLKSIQIFWRYVLISRYGQIFLQKLFKEIV